MRRAFGFSFLQNLQRLLQNLKALSSLRGLRGHPRCPHYAERRSLSDSKCRYKFCRKENPNVLLTQKSPRKNFKILRIFPAKFRPPFIPEMIFSWFDHPTKGPNLGRLLRPSIHYCCDIREILGGPHLCLLMPRSAK